MVAGLSCLKYSLIGPSKSQKPLKEALENGQDAFLSWLSARSDQGKAIPEPKTRPGNYVEADVSGRFLARMPKYIHARLVKLAAREGVGVNALVLAFIAAGLGQS